MCKFIFRTCLSFLLCIILSLFALAPSPLASAPSPVTASANSLPEAGDYACILTDDVYFYSAPSETRGLFLLPKSYYVRLVEYGADYSRVEYAHTDSPLYHLVGYAKTQQLTFVEYTPARPYLYYLFDVTYVIEDAPANDSLLTQITLSCFYYGDYPVGSKTYCYVLRGEEFGYVPKPDALSFERNTEYEEYLASLTPPQTDAPSKEEENFTKLGLVIAVCLLLPLLTTFLLKPSKSPSYEQEE